MRITLPILSFFLVTGFLACTDGQLLSNQRDGESTKKSGEGSEGSDEESQEVVERVDEPAEVAGAFLYCAVTQSKEEMRGMAEASHKDRDDYDPDLVKGLRLQLGCGLYDRDSLTSREAETVAVHWDIMNSNKSSKAEVEAPPELDGNMQFDTLVKVPLERVSGSVVAKMVDLETGTEVFRILDISLIKDYDAKDDDFEMEEALEDSVENAQALGFALLEGEDIDDVGRQWREDCDVVCRMKEGEGAVAVKIIPKIDDDMKEVLIGSVNSGLHTGFGQYWRANDGLVRRMDADEAGPTVDNAQEETALTIEPAPKANPEVFDQGRPEDDD